MMAYVLIIVFMIGVALAGGIGWCLNIITLVTKDDFESPYKAEVMRTIGIFAAPLGAIEGWLTFDEERK